MLKPPPFFASEVHRRRVHPFKGWAWQMVVWRFEFYVAWPGPVVQFLYSPNGP